MHVNKAHAALLIASAGALTGGTQRKPFPKLRPLKSALAAKPDLFGINEEDALLTAKREGQDSFRGAFEKMAFLQGDVFGYRDEARVLSNTAARKGQENYMSVLKGALGFPDTIKGNDGACAIDYSTPDLRTPVRDGGSPSVVVSYSSPDLRPAVSQAFSSVQKSNPRGASPPLLNHDLHAIDATPDRWRGVWSLTARFSQHGRDLAEK